MGAAMIERIVLIKFKEEAVEEREEVAAEAREAIEGVPGVTGVTVGVPADENAEGKWDLSIVVRFDRLADVEPYRVHPRHRDLVENVLQSRVEVIKAWNFRIREGGGR
jgi:heme-degrading monooxygenase HmoA